MAPNVLNGAHLTLCISMEDEMTTPRPWSINGKTQAGWRIDSMVPSEGVTGLDFMMNPVAIVPDKEDAELIVKLANDKAREDLGTPRPDIDPELGW